LETNHDSLLVQLLTKALQLRYPGSVGFLISNSITICLNIKRTGSTLLGPRYGDDGSSGEETPYRYNLKVFTPTEFNKTFLGY